MALKDAPIKIVLETERKKKPTQCGEMSELAEGARLEIVCTAKSGTEGSNPSLSAIFQRAAVL